MYDIPNEVLRKRLDFLIDSFDMEDLLRTPVRKLSLGQRMRAELVASLIHSPEILFLDEPTIGLDMVAKANLRDVINTMNEKEGTTILLTSHDIWDIEEICDRVVIINHGGIVFDGTIESLRGKFREKIISVHFTSPVDFVPQEHMEILEKEETRVQFRVQNSESSLLKTLSYLIENYPIEDLSMQEPDTESIIRTFYETEPTTWKNT